MSTMTTKQRRNKILRIVEEHKAHSGPCDCRKEVRKLAFVLFSTAGFRELEAVHDACDEDSPLDRWFDGIWCIDDDRHVLGWVA